MILRLKLTEEHLKLLPFIFIQESYTDDDVIEINKGHLYSLGSHLLEDLAYILGYQDQYIKGTEEDPDGKAFPDEVEEHLLGVHKYMKDNMYLIETLIHQFAARGGITAGEYKCKDNDLIWSKVEKADGKTE